MFNPPANYYEPADPNYSCQYQVVSAHAASSDVDMYCGKWDEDGELINNVWLCSKHAEEYWRQNMEC